MSVAKLSGLSIEAHPLGSELKVSWILPANLPGNYQVYVFKKESAITTDEIDAYFTDSESSLLTVFDSISNDAGFFYDFSVSNGTVYHYSAVIKDTDSGEYSRAVADSATPEFSGTVSTVDLKELLVTAIKRVFNNYSATANKDYVIRKSYSIENVKPPLIVIVRQGANDVQRLWGNVLIDNDTTRTWGKYESDACLVVWEDVNSDRRDTLTRMFRTHEKTIRRYLVKNSNAIDVQIVMGSDDIDPRWENLTVHTGQMLVTATFPSTVAFVEPEQVLPLDDVIHEGEF